MVVFVGGVALGQPATSIPIAAIVGLVAGLLAGIIMYQIASRISEYSSDIGHPKAGIDNTYAIALTMFMVVMTNILLLIGAGLFSRSVWWFEWHQWLKLLGAQSGTVVGDGPGTYPVQGNVWHLDCCNPINISDDQGWSVFNVILGWTNSATCTSISRMFPFARLLNLRRWLRIVLRILLACYNSRGSIHEIQGGKLSRDICYHC